MLDGNQPSWVKPLVSNQTNQGGAHQEFEVGSESR